MFPSPLVCYHIAALILIGFGLYGLTSRRTLVGMLISVELMLNGAGLAIAASSILNGGAIAAQGQIITLFIMGLAAAEATLLLAIIVVVFRRFGTTRTNELNTIQE
ncbi:MAG: NADH-quinone oxidoreductase subunit NuoK [Deltaproteobacteria bacterium]|jgi:NADH-quinone oxidoreductase subunit K|nr:NADH-quinone oxidoreductase subunit NuoK [Deltaproteobacteria bacterium]